MRNSSWPRAFLSAELRHVDPVEVSFSGFLQLSGVRLIRDGAGILLSLRWRCLRRLTRPWRCFVHVLDRDEKISSLDHEILGGHPAVTDWEPGDEAYERLRLWLRNPLENIRLRLGTYDPAINVRSPVLASNLPVTDESSAVWLEPGRAASEAYAVRFESACLSPCSVVFEGRTELVAYSTVRYENLLWLRLKWILRRKHPHSLRFFGHLIGEPNAETPALAQFDQDLPVEDRGPATSIEQNVVRAEDLTTGWLRVGLCNAAGLKRLGILSAKHGFDRDHRCAYLPLPPSPGL